MKRLAILLLMCLVLCTGTYAITAIDLRDEAIFYYDSDGNLNDSYGVYDTTTSAGTVSGVVGNALDYDATYNADTGYLNNMSKDLTINLWVNIPNTASTQVRYITSSFGTSSSPGNYENIYVSYRKDGAFQERLEFSMQDSYLNSRIFSHHNPQLNGTGWHMVTAKWDFSEKNVSIYVDGSLVGSNTSGSSWVGGEFKNENLYITTSGSAKVDASIDEYGFWERELSDSEIEFLYNNGEGDTYPFRTTVRSYECYQENISAAACLNQNAGSVVYEGDYDDMQSTSDTDPQTATRAINDNSATIYLNYSKPLYTYNATWKMTYNLDMSLNPMVAEIKIPDSCLYRSPLQIRVELFDAFPSYGNASCLSPNGWKYIYNSSTEYLYDENMTWYIQGSNTTCLQTDESECGGGIINYSYGADGYVYSNYTTPENATDYSQWNLSYNDGGGSASTQQNDIPDACFEQTPLQLRVKPWYDAGFEGAYRLDSQCYDGSWTSITSTFISSAFVIPAQTTTIPNDWNDSDYSTGNLWDESSTDWYQNSTEFMLKEEDVLWDTRIIQDSTAPDIESNASGQTIYTQNWSLIRINASDPESGVYNVSYCVDEADACIPTAIDADEIVLNVTCSDCTKYIRYQASNMDGDTSSLQSDNITLAVDSTAPTVTFSAVDDQGNSYTSGQYINTTYINVTLSCSDAGVGCDTILYCIDDSVADCTPDIEYTSPFQITQKPDMVVRHRANDTEGNLASISDSAVNITEAPIMGEIFIDRFTRGDSDALGNGWGETGSVFNITDYGILAYVTGSSSILSSQAINDNPNYISFSVTPAQADQTFLFEVSTDAGAGTDEIQTFFKSDGTITVQNINAGPYIEDVDYVISYENINWSSGLFDAFVNGNIIQRDISFNQGTQLDKVVVTSGSPSKQFVFDDVVLADRTIDVTINHTDNMSQQISCVSPQGYPVVYSANETKVSINQSGYLSDDPAYDDNGTYVVQVTCADGYQNSTDSFSYTVLSRVPKVDETAFAFYADDNVTFSFNASDADGDVVTNSTKWFVEGSYVAGYDNEPMLPSSEFAVGEQITHELTISDGYWPSTSTNYTVTFDDTTIPFLENLSVSSTSITVNNVGYLYADCIDAESDIQKVVFTATDPSDTTSNYTQNAAQINNTYRQSISFSTLGTWTYNQATCYDTAGQTNTTVANISISVSESEDDGGGGGGGGGIVIEGDDIAFRVDPTDETVRVAPASPRRFEFEVVNEETQNINTTVKVVSDERSPDARGWITLGETDLQFINLAIPSATGLAGGRTFVRYTVDAPADTEFGSYYVIIRVSADGVDKDYNLQIDVVESVVDLGVFGETAFRIGGLDVIWLYPLVVVLAMIIILGVWATSKSRRSRSKS